MGTQDAATSDFTLTYVDFIPDITTQDSQDGKMEFENLCALNNKANEWLTKNSKYKVKTCESLEVVRDSKKPFSVEKSWCEEKGTSTYFVRCLRLWLIPNPSSEAQQIDFINVVPTALEVDEANPNPQYEGFDKTVDKLNAILRMSPLPGRILNVETQDVKVLPSEDDPDANRTYCKERGTKGDSYVTVIRVYFESGPTVSEQIGYTDFVPDSTEEGKYESMSAVVTKASTWIVSQPGLPVINVQSINYKMSSGKPDPLRTYLHVSSTISYLRILRVIYAKSTDLSQRSALSSLSYKTFVPVQLTTGGARTEPVFETVNETMRRAEAWLKATGAKVVGAETPAVLLQTAWTNWKEIDHESTCTSFHEGDMFWMTVLRVYLDGSYQEPPLDALPPVPAVCNTEKCTCCTVL